MKTFLTIMAAAVTAVLLLALVQGDGLAVAISAFNLFLIRQLWRTNVETYHDQ